MTKTKFSPIPGFEDRYLINELGDIISLEKIINDTFLGKPRIRKEAQQILKLKTDKKGYLRVALRDGIKTHTKLVHRLVAMTFIANPENKPEVNHIDGNTGNCSKSNLEWSTHAENMKHAGQTGLLRQWKQGIIQTLESGEEIKFESLREAERITGISKGSIVYCIKKNIRMKKYKCNFKKMKYECK